MSQKTVCYPIVGMSYRPPADKLVKVLPVNADLTLLAEPNNPYDANAIGVWHSQIQLGYLPKDVAGYLRRNGFPPNAEVAAKFYIPFGSNIPHAKFDFEKDSPQ